MDAGRNLFSNARQLEKEGSIMICLIGNDATPLVGLDGPCCLSVFVFCVFIPEIQFIQALPLDTFKLFAFRKYSPGRCRF